MSKIIAVADFPEQYQQLYAKITAESLQSVWSAMMALALPTLLGVLAMKDISLDRVSSSAQKFKHRKQ